MPEENDSGASKDGSDSNDTSSAKGDTTTDDDTLGDAGKKALEAERKARRDADKLVADLQKKVKEFEDAGKTEIERAQNALAEAEKKAEAAEQRALRMEVAAAKGLTAAQAKRLVGTTQEELEADAADLLESFTPAKSGDDDTDTTPSLSRQPRPDLKPGGKADDSPPELSTEQILAKLPPVN